MGEEEPNPISQQQQHEEGGDQEQASAEEAVACDYCGESKAVVYCRADTARLCLVCDRHVHSANSVSSKHSRSLLCDSCASAPASILFCASSSSCRSSLLCSNCDFEANNNININSEINGVRRPVEPFSGCPTALDLVSILGVGGEAEKEAMIKKKKTKGEEDADDLLLFDRVIEEEVGMWVWETPQVVRLDDLIVPAAAASPATSVAILPLPKPKRQNVACGKQKEEILQQLHTLLKSETEFIDDHEEAHPIADFQLILPNNSDQDSFPVLNIDASSTFIPSINEEARSLKGDNNCWNAYPATFPCEGQQQSSLTIPSLYLNDFEETQTSECVATVSDAELGHRIIRENISKDTPKSGAEYLCLDRGSLLSRYKEKRKTRRYDKLIRHESRKARADSRVRIKSRFAKGNQVPNP